MPRPPLEEYNRLTGHPRIPESPYTPFEVVTRHIDEGISKAKAWREYLGLTQQQVAKRAALSKLEKQKRPRRATLERLAQALGISVEQLRG
ncbi:MAG: helix-turn-helix transcriptional regulator [Truepera sp.]|nr:helix-turn-helix transcriptional regulator [Truepera sp.]